MRLDLVAAIQGVAANPYCCCSPLKTVGEVEEVVTSMFNKLEQYQTSPRRFAAICSNLQQNLSLQHFVASLLQSSRDTNCAYARNLKYV